IDPPVDDVPAALDSSATALGAISPTTLISPPTTVRYRALAWLTGAACLAYLCRNAVGVSESTVREALGLTLEQSGWFMGAFFWTYAIFQIPSAWFSERVGTRVALGIFI